MTLLFIYLGGTLQIIHVETRNFVFRAERMSQAPLNQTENELFHETDPALDSSGLNMEKYLSVWLQGDGDEQAPTVYTNVYVRTATLDPQKRVGFLATPSGSYTSD